MQVVRRKRISAVDLRARVPAFARALALFLLIAGGIFVGVSYYKMRHNTPFRMKSEAPALSKEITGIINGYEQRITKDNRLYLWRRATSLTRTVITNSNRSTFRSFRRRVTNLIKSVRIARST